jgi:hypothetical protein
LKFQSENLQIPTSSYCFQIMTITEFYEIIISVNMKAISLKICWTIRILYEKLQAAIPTIVRTTTPLLTLFGRVLHEKSQISHHLWNTNVDN